MPAMNHGKPLILGIGEILWDLLPGGKQLGGAPANFAFHAAALGARALPVSRVGDDPLGREILARLSAVKVDCALISIDPAHPTGVVDVTLDPAGAPEYVIREGAAWDFLAADEKAMTLAASADAVCFGTLGQRSPVAREAIERLISATPSHCLRVFDINLRQHYYQRDRVLQMLGRSSILKLNDAELPVVADMIGAPAEVDGCIGRLFKAFKLQFIALTRGANGSILFSADGGVDEHPGVAAKVVDTVGAGDAFTAALVVGLLQGQPLARINALANRLAAAVCAGQGAMPRVDPAILADP